MRASTDKKIKTPQIYMNKLIPILIIIGVLIISGCENSQLETTTDEPDTSSCREIENLSLQDDCYREVYRKDSEKRKNDPSSCNDIEDPYLKDSCYYVIATENNDSSICESISHKYVFVHENACYYVIASGKNDPSICENIKDDAPNTPYTKNSCYYKLAEDKRDPSICKNIKDNSPNSPANRDMCYFNVESEINDKSICENIEDLNIKNWCLT